MNCFNLITRFYSLFALLSNTNVIKASNIDKKFRIEKYGGRNVFYRFNAEISYTVIDSAKIEIASL